MAPVGGSDGHWRVGFTKFATRMLGELVEANFVVGKGSPVSSGLEIGTVEGFKAASSVFCVMDGEFHTANPTLDIDACIVRSDPYIDGWLYEVRGTPENDHLDADQYIALLEQTINRMQAAEEAEKDAGESLH